MKWHAIKLENQHEEDLIESSSAQNFESEKLFSSYQIYDQFDHLGNEFQVEKVRKFVGPGCFHPRVDHK